MFCTVSIPTQVCVYTQAPTTFKTLIHRIYWSSESEISPCIAEHQGVLPGYPVPGDATDRVRATALRWAERPCSPLPEPNLVTRLRVVGYEERGNGGRAWKVLDSMDRMFDLREDVLLDALVTGVCVRGLLSPEMEFSWVRFGTQMTLVRRGSRLWDKALERCGGVPKDV